MVKRVLPPDKDRIFDFQFNMDKVTYKAMI